MKPFARLAALCLFLVASSAFASATFRRVVGPEASPDGIDTFASVADALQTAPALASGAVIEIAPGAIPGQLFGQVNVTGLVIRGAASLDATEVPALIFNGSKTFSASNLRLENLNLVFYGNSTLTITGSAFTMTRCVVFGPFGVSSLQLDGLGATLSSNRFVFGLTGGAGGSAIVSINNATQTTLKDNLFLASTPGATGFLAYTSAGTKNDLIEGNRFFGPVRAGGGTSLLSLNFAVSDVTIRDNLFANPDEAFLGIFIAGGSQNILIEANRFELQGATQEISFSTSAGLTSSFTLRGNDFAGTSNAQGINIALSNSGTNTIVIEGNRFRNQRGFSVSSGGASVTGIDFGGGGKGSLGANDFSAYTQAAALNSGAIVHQGAAATGNIAAQGNVFTGDPEVVVLDAGDDGIKGDVVTAPSLTGDTAFVAALYARFLRRPADFTNASDAGAYLALLTAKKTPRAVATRLIRSQESLTRFINDAYRDVLGRSPTPAEITAALAPLKLGLSEESLLTRLFGSAEGRIRYSSDARYLSAIFAYFLRRAPTDTEAAAYLKLAAKSRTRPIAVITATAEFRALRTTLVFDDILHRAPTAAELLKLKTKDRIAQLIEAAQPTRAGL